MRKSREGQGEKGISGQNCDCLAKGFMARWESAPKIVVIDCWQVVVDQREAVDEF
jgi:hypothetical protein